MILLGNILWCIFGGAFLAVLWFLAGILCCCTIIGIPVGIQCLKFGHFVLWPFGHDIRYSNQLGPFFLNVLWILLFGWSLASASLLIGLIWCITLVGIPFGLQSFKFARLAVMPFGAEIVSTKK